MCVFRSAKNPTKMHHFLANNADSSLAYRRLMAILFLLHGVNGLSGTPDFNYTSITQDLSSSELKNEGIKSKGNDDFILGSRGSGATPFSSAIFETSGQFSSKSVDRTNDAWWSNEPSIQDEETLKSKEGGSKFSFSPPEDKQKGLQDGERSQADQSKMSEVRILPPKDFLDRMTLENGPHSSTPPTGSLVNVKKLPLSKRISEAVKSDRNIADLKRKSDGLKLLKKLGLKDNLEGAEQQDVPSFSLLFGKSQRKAARFDLPGSRRKDFPSLTSIPITDFSCIDGPDELIPRPAGFYADSETRCQVYHYCHFDGRQDSFLCPRGTVFNQAVFVCDWWYNVDCGVAQSLYQLNDNLYKTSKSDSPRGIRPGSGNDDLIDELKSILNSARRDRNEFLDFDDINVSGIGSKKRTATQKKSQQVVKLTTKRTPENFDENFVLEDETEEPLTLRPGFQSSRGNFQQFQSQQLQQIKNFVGQRQSEYNRKKKTQKKPFKNKIENPLPSYEPVIQKPLLPINDGNLNSGSFYDPNQELIVSYQKAPKESIPHLYTNSENPVPTESGAGRDTLLRIKELIENEQDRFKDSKKPVTLESINSDYNGESSNEDDEGEDYDDEDDRSNKIELPNYNTEESSEDGEESDYYYSDSKGNNEVYDQFEAPGPLPPVVSFQTRPQNMELEVQSIVSQFDDEDDLGDRRVSVAALKAAKSRLKEASSPIRPPKWEIQDVENTDDAELIQEPDDIISYDDDYSQENSFQKGLDLSPSQKPSWNNKMNSSVESGKARKDGFSDVEIQNGGATLESVPSLGQVLMHDQWMINGIEAPSPPFSTLKPKEEKIDVPDAKPQAKPNSIGFDTLLTSMKAFDNSHQIQSGNIWTEISKKRNTKKQEISGNSIKRSTLTESNSFAKPTVSRQAPQISDTPASGLSVVSAPNLQQLQQQINQLNEKIHKLPRGSVVDTSFKPSPLLSATGGGGSDLGFFSSTQSTNNVNLPSAASQNLLQQQLTKQQLLILKLHQQQEQHNRQLQQPSGGNGILPRDQPSLPPFNSNNRVIDQQRWAAGRRKDEDLELHPENLESLTDDDNLALLEKSSLIDDRFEVVGDKCYIIVSGIPHQVGEAIACPDNSFLFEESISTSSDQVIPPTQQPSQPGPKLPFNSTKTSLPQQQKPNPDYQPSHLKTPAAPNSGGIKGQKTKLEGLWDGLSSFAKTIGLSN